MQWCFKYAAKSKLEWDSYCGRVSDTEKDRLSLRPSSSPAVALSLSSVVSVTAAVSFLDGGRWCYVLNVMWAVMWRQNMQNTRASQAAITTEQIQSVHTECTGVVTRLVGKKEEKKNNIVTPTTCIKQVAPTTCIKQGRWV